MPKPQSDPEPRLSIIPAAPGYRVIHRVESILSVGEDIIGWRIQTHWDQGEHISIIQAITTHGVIQNPAGLVHPDGTFSYADRRFGSMQDAQSACSNLFATT